MKLQDQFGKRGFNIVALTGEVPAVLRAFLGTVDPTPNYPIAMGGASAYKVTGVPYAVLVGPDGKVAWEGGPGGLPEKDLDKLLKTVKVTPEMTEAKAGKRVAFAQKFADDKLYARAEYEMQQVVALHPATEAAKRAQEAIAGYAAPEVKAELDAQKEVAKLIGLGPTLERPADKMKGKEMEALGKKLAKKAADLRAKTPRAAKLAEDWQKIFEMPWSDMDERGNPMNAKKK